jgi:hypothetical protein
MVYGRAAHMKYYEIRIFNKRGKTSLVFHQLHLDDQSAIQAAMDIAEDHTFDVWRGMDCIYAVPVTGRIS